MANVGSGAVGQTLIGNGNGAGPRYANIGTSSGLTNHGVVISQAANAFVATNAGTLGQVLASNGSSADPSFQSVGSLGVITTITGDSGGPESPDGSGNFNIFGTGSITSVGTANTETIQLTGLTNHTVLVGAGTATITKVGPGSAGQVLQSAGASADPAYSTATYPSTAGTTGTILRSNGTNWVNTTATYPTTTTVNQVLYSSSANVIGGITATASAIMNTSAGGVPSFATSPACSGTLTAGTGLTATTGAITATAGNVVITAGNLTLPNTNAGGTQGEIVQGGTRYWSNFNGNLFIGSGSGNLTTTGTRNTGIGQTTLIAATTTNDSTAVGYNALAATTTGVNTAVGAAALQTVSTGTANVAVGYQAGASATGTSNSYLGYQAGLNQTTGDNNVGIGEETLRTCSSNNNVAVGARAMYSIGGAVTGDGNTAIGYGVLNVITSAEYNTGLGYLSLLNLVTGDQNIAIGPSSATQYNGAESSNIIIGNIGVTGESNKIRIGTAGSGSAQQNACYIAGINGVTVTGTAVLCAIDGQLGTIVSSVRYKDNIVPIEQTSVLDLTPVEFTYKADKTKTKCYGLIAEQVHEIFPYLCFYDEKGNPESVKYHELPVLLLKEIQMLKKRIEILEKTG